ncbi:MAG: hypothetical protein K8W52_45120 [Deltaproteobacteria bacterium]|nr:hypothetical protein [Deltaproteobacteria bacterium]
MITRARLVASLVALTATAPLALADGGGSAAPIHAPTAQDLADAAAKTAQAALDRDAAALKAVADRAKKSVEAAKAAVGFDDKALQTAVAGLVTQDPKKLAAAATALQKQWESSFAKLLTSARLDLARESSNLQTLLSVVSLGGLRFEAPSLAESASWSRTPDPTKTIELTLAPIATGTSIATAVGALHTQATTVDPKGTVIGGTAGVSAEFTVPAGHKLLNARFGIDIGQATTIAAAALGSATATVRFQIRLVEHRPDGDKEICSDRKVIAGSAATIAGIAPQTRIALRTDIECKVPVDGAQHKYAVQVFGVSLAEVTGGGGAAAILDAVIARHRVDLD